MGPQVAKSAELEWQPLVEEGVETSGLYVKVLRFDASAGRPPTFLLKFDPGASYPKHSHPAGEEVFVLEGAVRFGSIDLEAGDYLYTPPAGMHAVFSENGCVLLLMVPEEVQIL